MTSGDSNTIQNHEVFIWSVADLLRGDYKQSEYGKVILPLTVLRRLDCCLLYTSDAADERSSVDLGGRRIITNNNNVYCQFRPETQHSVTPALCRPMR